MAQRFAQNFMMLRKYRGNSVHIPESERNVDGRKHLRGSKLEETAFVDQIDGCEELAVLTCGGNDYGKYRKNGAIYHSNITRKHHNNIKRKHISSE